MAAGGVALSPIQGLNIVVALLSAIIAAVLQFMGDPETKHRSRVTDLQDERWAEISTELGDLMKEVEKEVDSRGNSDEDAPQEARYSLVIQQEYSRGALEDLETMLEELDRPKSLFKQCRNSRSTAFLRFVTALVIVLVSIIVLIAGIGDSPTTLALLLSGLGLWTGGSGVIHMKTWYDTDNELNEMYDEYDFM